MIVTDSQMEALLEHLQGSCLTLANGCDDLGFDEDDLTMEQLEYLDDFIILCPGCGWWVEAGEMVGDEACRDCVDEEEDF